MSNEEVTVVNNRAQQLFKLLVEEYIANGTPVPSKKLATLPGVAVSPATVRNVMGELESRGLVHSPHTSAGKIPTQQGLRFFVDSLLMVEPWDMGKVKKIEAELDRDLSPDELISNASSFLSDITQMTCLISTPKRDKIFLRHVEFLNLNDSRILVILVLNDREVQNRVIHSEKRFTDVELNQAANFINEEFSGLSLIEVRERVLSGIQEDKDLMSKLMQDALDIASSALDLPSNKSQDLVVSGESRLLDFTEDTDTVRALFEGISQKGKVLHLLDQCLQSSGVQLFIGEESGYEPLDEMSLVTKSYEVDGQVAGVLGVIGPKRMDYKDVIPMVDITASVLSAAIRY